MFAFFLLQAFGPKEWVVANVITTQDLTEDFMVYCMYAMTLIIRVVYIRPELLRIELNSKHRDKPNQILNHMYSNVEQNTEDIHRELDLRQSTSCIVERIKSVLDIHKAINKDLDHAALGWVAFKQLCIQLSKENQDLVHKLCKVQVNDKLCILPWYAMYYSGVYLVSIIPDCHILSCRFWYDAFFAFGIELSNFDGIGRGGFD